jgi:cytochrome c
MRQYGCQSCHIIPGITGAEIHVGPTLREFAKRPLIAGTLPNTPEIVVQWLREPQALRPRTLMPDLHVTAQHAQDMQAYLATLE